MIRRPRWRGLAAAWLIFLLLAALGCETDERREDRAYDALAATGADVDDSELFHCDVDLYRRYTGSTWRHDKDHVFTIKDESHVKAEVNLYNPRPDRTYSVHLAWIRPDGREIFRRYAEVTRHLVRLPEGVAPDSTGVLPRDVMRELEGRFGTEDAARIARHLARDPEVAVPVNEVVYRKAVDLGYESRRRRVDADERLNVDSRLNISREKQRDPGAYLLRVYLDRRLLSETPFTIQD
jgi:hypothetical protein